MSEVVRLISGSEKLVLDACDGKRTIVKATDIFLSIDPNFKNWGTDVTGKATPKTPVVVYEIAEDADFTKMFTSLNSDVSKLVLEQDQIMDFIQKYRDWLQKDSWATFFLFRAAGEFFVTRVRVISGGRLEVDIERFEDDFVWSAGVQRRLVVPQL